MEKYYNFSSSTARLPHHLLRRQRRLHRENRLCHHLRSAHLPHEQLAINATITAISAYTAVATISTEIPCATDTTANWQATNILAESALSGMST
jgi:hypothetical protein